MKRREDQIIDDLGVAMKYKLMRHRSKGDWAHKDLTVLLRELKREVVELEEEILSGKKPEMIISEAADVANYAAFIIEKVR